MGGRWSSIQVQSYNANTGAVTASYDAQAGVSAVGLVVKPVGDLSIYANYVQALEQGGTAPATAINFGAVAPPLVSEQQEVGVKYDFGRYALTAALFNIDKANSFTDSTARISTTQGREVHSDVELDGFGEVAPGCVCWLG